MPTYHSMQRLKSPAEATKFPNLFQVGRYYHMGCNLLILYHGQVSFIITQQWENWIDKTKRRGTLKAAAGGPCAKNYRHGMLIRPKYFFLLSHLFVVLSICIVKWNCHLRFTRVLTTRKNIIQGVWLNLIRRKDFAMRQKMGHKNVPSLSTGGARKQS